MSFGHIVAVFPYEKNEHAPNCFVSLCLSPKPSYQRCDQATL